MKNGRDMKRLILLVSFLFSIGCHEKGDIKDKELEIIINNEKYKLYTVFDGSTNIRILVPECKNCQVPISVNYVQTNGKTQSNMTTVIVPPSTIGK